MCSFSNTRTFVEKLEKPEGFESGRYEVHILSYLCLGIICLGEKDLFCMTPYYWTV